MTKGIRLIQRSLIREALIKSAPEESYEALIKKLERLLKEASNSLYAGLLQRTIDALRAGDNIKDALKAIEGYVNAMPEGARLILTKEAHNISRELYMAGFSMIKLENQGLNIAFNLKDIDAINAIGRHNIFWLGKHFEEVGMQLNEIVREFYEQNYTRQELAQILNERLKLTFKEDERYFEGLADHIATKTKELGRISGYQRAGIKYVKVKAILDGRTSQICRQMHGRIISVERLASQMDDILNAKSPEQLRAAQRWVSTFTGRTADLPKGVAGPPYHYRCRTTTAAYFEELDGEPAGEETYQFFDGVNTRKEKVLYKYYDKYLGRELALTEGVSQYAKKHGMTIEKIKSALRGRKEYGESNLPDSKGQLVMLSENGVFLAFRDNVVYNAYIPDRKGYFKDVSIGRFKKWAERLRLWFIANS